MIVGFEHYKEKWAVVSDLSIKPGLEAIERALSLVGNPHQQLKVVHIAGTNGKGSTVTMLDAVLSAHGVKVGKFMSPCVIDVHDQLQVAGVPMTETQMDALFQQMQRAGLSGLLTDFELLTVAVFLHFANEQVDIVLLEAGMGGRFDSTNIVTPIVSIITSIALEHTNFLGETLRDIAWHKAGIIKQDVPVIAGPVAVEAWEMIIQQATEQQAPLALYGEHFQVTQMTDGEIFTQGEVVINQLQRQMPGPHQAVNMALALAAFLEVASVLQVNIDEQAIQRSIAQASLAGRMEQVLPNVYFDGAHNPASADMLVSTIKEQFDGKHIHFIVGMLADKDVKTVLATLEQVSDTFIFVDFDNARAMPAKEIAVISRAINVSIEKNIAHYIQQHADSDTIIIVTGSLYLLTELRGRLLKI